MVNKICRRVIVNSDTYAPPAYYLCICHEKPSYVYSHHPVHQHAVQESIQEVRSASEEGPDFATTWARRTRGDKPRRTGVDDTNSENAIEILKKGYLSIAYSSMTMDDVERLFGISKQPIPMDFPSWEIPIPQTLAENLQDFDTVTDGSLENEAFARVRINIILQAVLRERRPFAASQARTLHLGFETPMSITLSQTVVISGKADYSLWYTSHEDRAHQLIIVEAKKARHVTSGLPQLLGYMGAVQLARRTAQKSNIAVFGVLTDAYQWDFVRVHNDGKYSLITFRWNAGQSQKIWDILNWMVAYAEVQSPLCSELS